MNVIKALLERNEYKFVCGNVLRENDRDVYPIVIERDGHKFEFEFLSNDGKCPSISECLKILFSFYAKFDRSYGDYYDFADDLGYDVENNQDYRECLDAFLFCKRAYFCLPILFDRDFDLLQDYFSKIRNKEFLNDPQRKRNDRRHLSQCKNLL